MLEEARIAEMRSAPYVPSQGPPAMALGVRWEGGTREFTERGVRFLWRAAGYRDDVVSECLRAHPILREFGFTVRWEGPGNRSALFWEVPGYDKESVAEECRHAMEVAVPAMRERERAEHRRKEEKRQAAAEELRTRPARAIAAATESLALRPWSWAQASDIADANAWLSRPEVLDAMHAGFLLTMVERADANVTRAAAALAVPYEPEIALARMPGVAAAALEACRLMSGLDSDRASERNSAGWGKTTTIRGHVLSAMERLDEAAASHALRALRKHRRQLPVALEARLFRPVSAAA